jgi:hypothetical protein
MVAIAQQNSHKISVAKWNEVDDIFGSPLAEKEFDGEIPAVVWAF